MKRSISLWNFLGFAVTSLGGTILHFLYDLTNQNVISALFSGVNESTFEHMKLLFFPMFFFGIVQSFFFKEYNNFWCIKLIGIVVGLYLIPTIFYTYNGIFGKSPDWINISIFFVSAAIAFIIETILFKQNKIECKHPKIAFLVICLIGLFFIIFTFYPIQIPFFQDPVTKTYGIS